VRRTAAIIVNISQTENKLLSFIHSLLNLDPAESENWQLIITNLRTPLYHARGSSPLPSKIRDSTVARIGILIIVEISLVIISFGLLAYFESQSTLIIGNSTNIAGKNRFLTSNVILEAERYLGGRLEVSKLNEAMAELDSNICTLRTGGVIAETERAQTASKRICALLGGR
jgi:hypothetical protein